MNGLCALLPRRLDRLQLSESTVVGGAALLIGLTSRAGAWLFKRLIDLSRTITYDGLGMWLNPIGPWTPRPTMPFNAMEVNPNNPNQVFVDTMLGFYYTNDITMVAPVWNLFPVEMLSTSVQQLAGDRSRLLVNSHQVTSPAANAARLFVHIQ